MNLFLDQDVYLATVRFLEAQDHDIVRPSDFGLSQAADANLLRLAQAQARIFITRDRDFGNLVFVQQLGSGVIYLRMMPATQEQVHAELAKVLESYSADELQRAFVVVDPTGHRFRRIG